MNCYLQRKNMYFIIHIYVFTKKFNKIILLKERKWRFYMSSIESTLEEIKTRDNLALEAKKKLDSTFFRKGLTVAIISGMCYGLYSAFVTVAMGKGVWSEWFGGKTNLSLFATVYIIGALGSALNDSMSAIWSWIIAGYKGKVGDFLRCINTKPGRIMILAAIIGGPIAGTSYIIALQLAGSIIIPITALCPAIGAVLARIIFKQKLNKRMILGVVVCVLASVLIGTSGITGEVRKGTVLGIVVALIAAFGWGIEGVVAGYGTSLIDSEIGIMIRQTTSGLFNLFILLPLLSFMDGNIGLGMNLLKSALTDTSSLIFFVISGFFALFAFSLWYKGNSMCGAALGMACNGAYSFWGPFFCWIIIGVLMGIDGWNVAPIVWIGAVIMVIGIFLIAVNPLTLFGKKEVD